ncbi:hypothetical protein AVEN_79226-1 [Araneus ventricosus]|uniref:Uncharacterized protein n=1 Tax=Araneus ventricosus TaxID=182803 RepID=A0A4Y2K8W8_ARAVE|nr:hypothetical protein AVEN_79226-1 [Araneus ventricosus]
MSENAKTSNKKIEKRHKMNPNEERRSSELQNNLPPPRNPFTEQKTETVLNPSLSSYLGHGLKVYTALAGTEPTERKKDTPFNIYFFFSSLSHKLQSQ